MVGTRAGKHLPMGAPAAWGSTVTQRLASGRICRSFGPGQRRGIDISSTLANPAAGPGYFLAGDAAAIVDPLSSHGRLRALMSGMNAAHHAAAVLRYSVAPLAAASAYNLWVG